MEIIHLSSTVSIKTVSENEKDGVFEIEGLFAGYGLTLGNALAPGTFVVASGRGGRRKSR